MPSRVQMLTDKGHIMPPAWLPTNTHYETMTGSVAYGCSADESDMDIIGFCIPKKEIVFPHLAGAIYGFGRSEKDYDDEDCEKFTEFQQHHVFVKDEDRQYDMTIYGIAKYFSLLMACNPNMIDSVFTPQFCVLHITKIGSMVRDNRKIFLHREAYHRFRGYAFEQLHKARTEQPTGNRKELRETYGMDTKFLYHVARLSDECEQILEHGDLDLQRSREYLKAIRRGEVPEEEIRQRFCEKEKYLTKLYETSSLPLEPNRKKIKQLLINCLEEHYGNLEKCIVNPSAAFDAVSEIRSVLAKYPNL